MKREIPEPGRWKRIDEIFQAVVGKTAEERKAHLDEACAGDDVLRLEVESLLVYGERARGFLATSALQLVADTLAREGSRRPVPDVLNALFESDLVAGEPSRLRVTAPSGSVTTLALDKDSITVGRAEANQLSFPEDDGLSREHAIIEPGEDGWTVRDLGSKNGTFLNGKRLEARQRLRPGDEILASCVTLTYYGGST